MYDAWFPRLFVVPHLDWSVDCSSRVNFQTEHEDPARVRYYLGSTQKRNNVIETKQENIYIYSIHVDYVL